MALTLQSIHDGVEDFLLFFRPLWRAWNFLMLGTNLLWIFAVIYALTNNQEVWFWLWNLSVMGMTVVLGVIAYCGFIILGEAREADFGVLRHVDAFIGTVFGFLMVVVVLYGIVTYL